MKKKPVIAVTGALGHIGSKFIHTVRRGDYAEVRLVDNLATQRYASLFGLPAGVKFRFYEENILTADLVKTFRGCDAVVHLAAMPVPEASYDGQSEVERINFEGTRRVAEACLAVRANLLFVSTTSVYSGRDEELDETAAGEKTRPFTPYAQTKLRAEQAIAQMGREKKLRYTLFRFGTIFGTSPGMRFHAAVNRFCWQACQGKPLTVWKTAMEQQRPYLDVVDAAAAIRFVLTKGLFKNELYNVVTVNARVRDVVAAIRREVPSLRVKIVESKAMNEYTYTVSTEKFRAEGFRFQGRLERGIAGTVRALSRAFGGVR